MEIKDKWIEVGEEKYFIREIVVNDDPERPYLVFLHDALGSVSQWKQFPEMLVEKSNLNAILFDRTGHGRSDYSKVRTKDYLQIEANEVLPGILSLLNIKKPILIGHSDGATIALLYGARYPSAGIISIAAHVFVEEVTLNSMLKVHPNSKGLINRLKKHHGEKSEALYNSWRETWLSPEFNDFNIEVEIRSITAPVLVIQAKDDEYGSAHQVEKIIKNVSSQIVEVYKPADAGHHPHLSEAEYLSTYIAKFIRTSIS